MVTKRLWILLLGVGLVQYYWLVAQEMGDPYVEQEVMEYDGTSEPEDESQTVDAEADTASYENSLENQEPIEEEQTEQEDIVATEVPEEVSESFPEEQGVQEEVSDTQEIEQEPQPELGPDEIMGIDTVDLEEPQGNWLYKRVWWERAEAKYEKMRNAVNKILEIRIGFFAKRAELDKSVLDPFYIKIGLSQGELQEILAELITQLSKQMKDKKEEDILDQAESDKSELEGLQKQIQQVIKYDNEIEDAIMTLVEQINNARKFEQDAWKNFKNIARVLDDKKARELFYKVDNSWRNIQEILLYIEQTYSESFDQLIERVKEIIQRVDTTILALKERGLDLKQRLFKQEEMLEQEEEEPEPKGIITRYIFDPAKSMVHAIWSVIRWPVDKIIQLVSPSSQNDRIEEDDEKDDDLDEQQPDIIQEQSVEKRVIMPNPPVLPVPTASLVQDTKEDDFFDMDDIDETEIDEAVFQE